jgi:hypothetical protein
MRCVPKAQVHATLKSNRAIPSGAATSVNQKTMPTKRWGNVEIIPRDELLDCLLGTSEYFPEEPHQYFSNEQLEKKVQSFDLHNSLGRHIDPSPALPFHS